MDLQLVETGNGGDILLNGNDLALVQGFENMPYIALFGGNLKQSTPQSRGVGEEAFDWWGNNLFMPNLPSQQFNSQTERTLNNVALVSGNLSQIQNAVNADLQFMQDFAQIKVDVAIVGPNTVVIQIFLTQPNNLSSNEYIFIWDGTQQDLTGAFNYVTPPVQPIQNGLEYYLQVQL